MNYTICGKYLTRLCLLLFSAALLSLSLSSCTSTPEETDKAPQAREEPSPPAKPETEPPPEPEEKPELPEDPETTEEEAEVEEEYEMDEEEYQETKRDLSQLVSELNEIISSRDYGSWLEYLTDEYKEYYSDPEVLKEYSDAPVLKKHNISLRSLRDYFNYVVVASRRNVQVDDIKAVGPDKVKAYMDVDGKTVVVYTLEKMDDGWKITR